MHPAQRQWVERDYSGPARVSGAAGTGKTIVALHRAVFLARNNPDSRVLLTTFSDTLANALRTKLRRLISNERRLGERLEVHAMDAIGERLYERHFGRPQIATRDAIRSAIAEATKTAVGKKSSLGFLLTEWEELVMPGNWKLGRRIAMSSAWDERPACRRRSVQRCGRSSKPCALA